ncbi:MAG TPA: rod shape-determining protein MreC [Burkholderiaceae bacterium]|nr:rod shape-determining protein MreC [Burkholderiaceae bacterium]
MPLGTLDRTPPPFFRQGPSALTKLAVFSALAIFLMAADSRLKYTQPIRAVLATALLPVQRALLVPVELVANGSEYLRGLDHAIVGERDASAKLAAQAERAARVEQLAAENARLRALLGLRPALTVRTHTAEVLYEATDPYSRKLFIDRGSTQGVLLGSPVINDSGVLGQVTRVYPLSAEITLLGDKDAAIPVFNPRTQQRSAAFGVGDGEQMELRFMAGNADVQVGDLLTTSGVDGVYPPGLAVATVVKVERKADSGFARIVLRAKAQSDGVRHVLVLDPLSAQMPQRPEPETETTAKPRKGAKR